GLLRRDHRLLVDQPAARIKRIGDAAFEDSQFQPLKLYFHAVADAPRLGAYRPERAFKAPRAVRMIAWKIEEFVEPGRAPPLPGIGPVLRPRVADNWNRIHADHRDQRPFGIQ